MQIRTESVALRRLALELLRDADLAEEAVRRARIALWQRGLATPSAAWPSGQRLQPNAVRERELVGENGKPTTKTVALAAGSYVVEAFVAGGKSARRTFQVSTEAKQHVDVTLR